MTTVLSCIAGVVMLVGIALFYRQNASSNRRIGCIEDSKYKGALILLVVSGVAIAFGGFWIDWMLWAGIILIELGCVVYYSCGDRPKTE